MKKAILALCIVSLISVIGSTAASAERRAILAAIGRYQDRTVPVLTPDGEQIDISFMRQALQKKGFQNFTEFPEDQATKAKILDAIDRLAIQTQPDDVVVIYLSGHGSRSNGHFAFCPWDATLKSNANDITDVELEQHISRFKSKKVTLLLDCCFNEYHIKGVRHRPKVMPRPDAARPQPWYISDKVILLAASQEEEEAQEEQYGPGRWVGVFTHMLCDELNHATPETTYRELIDRLQSRTSQYLVQAFPHAAFSQTPQLHGSEEQKDRPIFGSPSEIASGSILPHVIVSTITNGQAVLNRGKNEGITEGSEYALFPAGEKHFLEDHRIGTLRITHVENETARATVEGSTAEISGPCLAVEQRHAEDIVKKIKVRIEASDEIGSQIRQSLSPLKFVEVDSLPAQLVLKVTQSGDLVSGCLYGSDGKTALWEPVSVPGNSPGDLVTKLTPQFENFVFLCSLVSLQNPNPALKIHLTTDKSVYHLGEQLHVKLEVTAAQDCYLGLIHIDANGTPQVLFPNQYASETKIQAGHTYLIPSDELGFSRFTFKIKPPVGRETIIAIGTLNPVDWKKMIKETLTPHAKGIEVIESVQKFPLSQWGIALTNFIIEESENLSGHADIP